MLAIGRQIVCCVNSPFLCLMAKIAKHCRFLLVTIVCLQQQSLAICSGLFLSVSDSFLLSVSALYLLIYFFSHYINHQL